MVLLLLKIRYITLIELAEQVIPTGKSSLQLNNGNCEKKMYNYILHKSHKTRLCLSWYNQLILSSLDLIIIYATRDSSLLCFLKNNE